MTVVSHFFWGWYVFRNRSCVWRFACAAAAPDLPYFALLGYYSLRSHVNGFTDLGMWDVAWRSPLICALHSFVPWAVTAALVCLVCTRRLRQWLLPVWAGWLSHVAIDMLTHCSDGYPIFYPLSAYRFPTSVSYWEPAYHGRAFMLADVTLIAVLSAYHLLTRRRATLAPSAVQAAGR